MDITNMNKSTSETKAKGKHHYSNRPKRAMYKFQYTIVILWAVVIHSIGVAGQPVSCPKEPVELDEEFIECCEGKPSFVSQACIEKLSDENALTDECLVECLYKELKIYKNGTIDMQEVKDFFHANVSSSRIQDMFLNAFEYCSKIEPSKLEQMFAFTDLIPNHGCELYPVFVDQCIWYHTLAYCPNEMANTSELCVTRMKWTRECLLK